MQLGCLQLLCGQVVVFFFFSSHVSFLFCYHAAFFSAFDFGALVAVPVGVGVLLDKIAAVFTCLVELFGELLRN